jgi:hypothetical protein
MTAQDTQDTPNSLSIPLRWGRSFRKSRTVMVLTDSRSAADTMLRQPAYGTRLALWYGYSWITRWLSRSFSFQ